MLVSNYKQYVRMRGICGFEEYLSPPRDGRIPYVPCDLGSLGYRLPLRARTATNAERL